MRVKIFDETSHIRLENKINEWLSHNSYKVLGTHFSGGRMKDLTESWSAMIVYDNNITL